jgi:hypothetical protein
MIIPVMVHGVYTARGYVTERETVEMDLMKETAV